jgi:excisionase family DNA binding protein
MDAHDRLISITEAAKLLGVPLATLRWWRSRGLDPYGFRVGRHVKYRLSDVLHWIDELAAGLRPRSPAAS